MHLGNVFAALLSWLSARSKGGEWVLRIEDLDPQRSKTEYARLIEDDLQWLGLFWDEGGLEGRGDAGPYMQSMRGAVYENVYSALRERGLLYDCFCTRADIMATQAPHESDGRTVYKGTCRPAGPPPWAAMPSAPSAGRKPATRIYVPDADIAFADRVYGPQSVNLSTHCGDFIVRRSDGAWAYQLAVVADDALMGVTEVVRGCDLLLSTAQQLYLYDLMGWEAPAYAHVPLLSNEAGQRLSKRDRSLSMEEIRKTCSPSEVIGRLAALAGIIPGPEPCSPEDLASMFDWDMIEPKRNIVMHQA